MINAVKNIITYIGASLSCVYWMIVATVLGVVNLYWKKRVQYTKASLDRETRRAEQAEAKVERLVEQCSNRSKSRSKKLT